MIEFVEIRSKADRELIGIIDGAKSVLWHSVYFGVGDFEIYAAATPTNIVLLQEGNYVTRQDDLEVGIIESVVVENDAIDGMMITASGRFAKSILDRRHIYNLSGTVNRPTILRGNVESAVRSVVANNAILCTSDSRRNIPILELGALSNIPAIIVDDQGRATQKQVSYKNLLTYTDEVLEEYGIGAILTLDDASKKFQYSCYIGADRSVDNTDGNEPVIFSQEYDNLTSSVYSLETVEKKTSALIGGEGEGTARFYSVISGTEEGLERRETWVDASSISKTYTDSEDVEHEYTDAEYKEMIDALGKQTLATLIKVETFEGSLNVTGGIWRFNVDYMLGDVVTVQDNAIGKYANVRITEVMEAQDENGYTVEFQYRT